MNIHFLKNQYNRNPNQFLIPQTPSRSGVWKNIKLSDKKSANLFVSFDQRNRETQIKKHNLSKNDLFIYFRREPTLGGWTRKPIKSLYDDPKILNVFDYTSKNKYHASTWHIPHDYDYLTNLKYNQKQNQNSLIASDKRKLKSHKQRYNFVEKLSTSRLKDNIDFSGKFFNPRRISSKSRMKYFLNYEKSICIENCQINNYFTEKFIDPLLCWCLPIYIGCLNIDEFFPENSFRKISFTSSIKELQEILEKPVSKEEIKGMAEARNLILNKYNIWSSIASVV